MVVAEVAAAPVADGAPLRRTVALDFAPQPLVGNIIGAPIAEIAQAGESIANHFTAERTQEAERQKRKAEAEKEAADKAAERARVQGQLVGARLAGAQQLDDLYGTFENDTDPSTQAQRFAEGARKIHDTLAQGITDPEALNSFALSFGEMSESRRVNLKHDALQRQTAESIGNLDKSLTTFGQQAANAKSEAERDAALNGAEDNIRGLVGAGVISAEDGVKRIHKFRSDLSVLDARRAVFADPTKALKRLQDEKQFADLEPLDRQTLIEHAQAEIDQRARALDVQRLQMREQARDTLDQVKSVLESGYPVAPELMKQAQGAVAALGPREVGLISQLQSVQRASAVNDRLRGATPAEAQALITQLDAAAAKGATGPQAEAAIAARRFYGTMSERIAKDPLAWASQQGVVAITPLQLNGQDAPAAFADRVRTAELVAQRYGVRPSYLTDSETDALKTRLQSGNADDRLAAVNTLTKGFGARAGEVLQTIAKDDPVLAHAAGLLGGNPSAEQIAAARDAIRGDAMLSGPAKDGAADLRPGAAARGAPAAIDAGKALGMAPELRAQVMATAEAIYAARAAKLGLRGQDANPNSVSSSRQSQQLYQDSINAALGATTGRDGKRYGGLSDYRGAPVVVPSGFAADDFENTVHGLSDADLVAGSGSGAAPEIAGRQFGQKDLRRSYLISVGDGQYVVSTTDPSNGPPAIVNDSTGAPYRLDLNRVPRFNFGAIGRESLQSGMLEPGNIDVTKRPIARNADGSISTVRSISIEEDGKEVLIPTVSPDGKVLSNGDAIALYKRGGQHLGKFRDAQSATVYAGNLHLEQARRYGAGR